MTLIADILLAAGALGAAFYCFVLGQRLRKFNNLERGMGGAVAVLSAQVDDLEKTLSSARKSAAASTTDLERLTMRAEDVRRQLELQIAALHDMVPAPSAAPAAQAPAARAPTQAQAPTPASAAPVAAPPPPEPGEPMFVRHRTAGRTS